MFVLLVLSALVCSARAWSPAPLVSSHRTVHHKRTLQPHLRCSQQTHTQCHGQITSTYASSGSSDLDSKWDLNVAIVGAGPSGLLLAHRLVQSQLPLAKIDIYESRSDPRDVQKNLGGRAYALGLGMRGRSAIRTVDEDLWMAVKKRGYACERFRLHLTNKLNVKLRDAEEGVEPSVLIYQSDLCGGLLDELDRRTTANEELTGKVEVNFESNIDSLDLSSSMITMHKEIEASSQDEQKGPYDLIVGCDGANSIVRGALQTYSPPNTFSCVQRKLLPGCFKVARTEQMPPLMDPESVGLLLPKSGGITAFVEPTVGGGSCILFAGKLSPADSDETTTTPAESDDNSINLRDVLFPNPDSKQEVSSLPPVTETITNLITETFPLLEGTPGMEDIVQQLLTQRTSVASSVKCNTYNSNSDVTAVALVGDSAHATGGISGQGCNSALLDSATLADCLIKHYNPSGDSNDTPKKTMLHQSVSAYSQKAVKEGHALYDLSFGNDGKTLPIFRNIRAMLSNGIDAVFGGKFGIGKKPLQTLLASSSTSFTEIRRDREKYFAEEFPTDAWFTEMLENLYERSNETE